MNISFFDILELLGTMAFAISGALTAMGRKLDLFGIFIISFVTAIGGGTLRDVLIGNTPVSWMEHSLFIFVIGAIAVFAIVFRNSLNRLKTSLFLFDTIGLGVFTISGVEIGIATGLHPVISIALGAMTGTFGGVIRDILCNEIPVIFRKEIYATASLTGGALFVLLYHLWADQKVVYLVTVSSVILIRLLAVRYHISLPSFSVSGHHPRND